MRQVVLDTETTGLDHRLGDRVIEIGCVELVSRKLTGRRYHTYLNPGRPIEEGAKAVHGLSDEFLADKPRFADIAEGFVEFVADAELIIHNAAFDLGFLDHELDLLGRAPLSLQCAVIDTLKLARELHPGRRNSLDALCERYAIDNSQRQLHGALLDAELLADVYVAMTRGQESLLIELEPAATAAPDAARPAARPALRVLHADAAERVAHERVLEEIAREAKGGCLWRQLGEP